MIDAALVAAPAEGVGPPLVLLHASGMSSAQFGRLRREAATSFTVTTPDLLGVGATPMPEGPYTLQREVDALLALLDTLPAPARVVGHSFGGLVAVEAALRAPTRFAALALYEPVIVVLAAHGGSDAAKAEVARIADLMTIPVDDGGALWVEQFIDWWNGPGFFARMPPAAQKPQLATALQAHRQAGVVGEASFSADDLRRLAVPTLFLIGETSPTAARESARLAAAAMPSARVDVVTGAGHMGPLTHAAAVNERLLQFLRS